MTTTTETTREEGVVTGRDGLQYASLAHVLLGEPLENWRNLEVGRLTRQGKAEIAVAWAKWFDEGRAKGHLSEHGFYVAAKIRKEPAALPPADSSAIGLDATGTRFNGPAPYIDLDEQRRTIRCTGSVEVLGDA
jgi:hypothetical protein